jgi:hypothetical protein
MHYQEMSMAHMTVTVKAYLYPAILPAIPFANRNLNTPFRINLFERNINCALFTPGFVIQ